MTKTPKTPEPPISSENKLQNHWENRKKNGFEDTSLPLLSEEEQASELKYEPKQGCWTKYSQAFKQLLPWRPTQKDKTKLPSNSSGIFSFIGVSWLSRLMWKANRKGITVDDMWTLDTPERSQYCTERLESYWANEKKRASELDKDSQLWRAAWRFIKTRVITAMLISIFVNSLQCFGPSILMKLTLQYVDDSRINHSYGAILIAATAFNQLIRCSMFTFAAVLGTHTATRLSAGLQGIIFKKILNLKSSGEKLNAQVNNIISNDLERIIESVVASYFLSATPVIFILNTSYATYLIGPWALMGMAVYLLFFPIMGFIAKLQARLRLRTVKKTDKRISLMTEILNSLRLIKIYAWEDAFSQKIQDYRLEEQKMLQIGGLLQSVSSTAVPCVSIFATLSTILGCTLTGVPLTSVQAFTLYSIFTSMQFTIGVLPFTIRSIAEGKIALGRIQNLLELPDHSKVEYGLINNNLSVSIKNGSFKWETYSLDLKATPVKQPKKNEETTKQNGHIIKEEADELSPLNHDDEDKTLQTLNGINFSVEKNKVVGICGSIGAGKSSLLSAICGDMQVSTGQLQVNGRLAIVSQQPWIYNATLRDNILLGQPFDAVFYDKVIDICCLRTDMQLLAKGDLSEIGEKGVNLSGGQKQRLSLARAVYQNRDIYLLDDPLSAVDSKVAKHIFNHCIKGHLASKTILLVTHSPHYLEKCDEIVFLKDCRILERGTHDSLVARRGDYFHLMGFDKSFNRSISMVPTTPEADTSDENKDESESQNDGKLTVEETKEVGTVSGKVYLKFMKVCGGYIIAFLLLCATMFFNLIRIFNLLWIKTWMDAGDGQESVRLANQTFVSMSESEMKGSITNNPDLWMYQLVYGLTAIVIFMTGIGKGIAITFRIYSGASRLHRDMFLSILRVPVSFLDMTPIGRILNRFSKDIDEVDSRIPFFLDFVTQGMLSIMSQTILVCVMFPIAAAPLSIIIAMFVFIDIFISSGVREMKRIDSMLKSPVLHNLVSATSGLTVIRTFGRENVFIRRFFDSVDQHSSANIVWRLSSRWFTYRMDLMGTAGVISITAICIFTKGYFSTAVAGVALASINGICGFIPFVMKMKTELQSRMTSVERIMEYAYSIEAEAPQEISDAEPDKSWPSHGIIELCDVQMRYRKDMPIVLKNVNIKINSSEKIGVVGRTGAGKSSLISALLRLVEVESGKVIIDNVDIKSLGLKRLRSSVSVIPQDPILFEGTIRYNLDPFGLHTDEELWLALERSHLKKTIHKLTNQLSALVDGGGENFSVGEKQLICLTRALLRSNKILILDEATASVDVETDQLIQKTIQDAFSDCTVITIAHRLNTVTSYDRILVLHAGEVVEFDTPENLMKMEKYGLFKEMMAAIGVHKVEHLNKM